MATGLIDIIKRAALEVMSNEQLCDLRYGTVASTNPIRVQITSQLTIPSSLLVVPQRLTDELQIGDKVALLRKHGGQSYFILDRI